MDSYFFATYKALLTTLASINSSRRRFSSSAGLQADKLLPSFPPLNSRMVGMAEMRYSDAEFGLVRVQLADLYLALVLLGKFLYHRPQHFTGAARAQNPQYRECAVDHFLLKSGVCQLISLTL